MKPRQRDGRRRQPPVDIGVVGRRIAQVLLAQIAVKALAQAIDGGGIALQRHALAQPVGEHRGHHLAVQRVPGFLFHHRRQRQQLGRRLQRGIRRPVFPGGIQAALLEHQRPAQQLDVVAAGPVGIGVRRKAPLGVDPGHAQLLHQRGIGQARERVVQIRGLLQGCPQVTHVPAFHQRDELALFLLAAHQLVQKPLQRGRPGDQVVARLDPCRIPAQPQRQGHLPRRDIDTGLLQHLGQACARVAARHIEHHLGIRRHQLTMGIAPPLPARHPQAEHQQQKKDTTQHAHDSTHPAVLCAKRKRRYTL